MIDILTSILQSGAGEQFFSRLPGEAKLTPAGAAPRGTKSAARVARRQILKRLKAHKTNKVIAEILPILSRCRLARRCCHAACPICTYAMQNLLTALMQDFRGVGIQLDQCLTIIPKLRICLDDATFANNEEWLNKIGRLRAKLDRVFDAARITIVFGSIDYDVNEFPQGQFDPHRKPHFHGLCQSIELTKAADKAIRKNFTKGGSVNTPVLVEDYDGRDNWGRYMFKPPDRRKVRRQADANDPNSVWSKPDYKQQTVPQHLHQVEVLHRTGWKQRIFTRGLGLQKSRFGAWQLHILKHDHEE